MTTLLRCWLPMVKPLLRTILVFNPKPFRDALVLLRLRQEFGLVEVHDIR